MSRRTIDGAAGPGAGIYMAAYEDRRSGNLGYNLTPFNAGLIGSRGGMGVRGWGTGIPSVRLRWVMLHNILHGAGEGRGTGTG